jgi:hypothetical protein
VLHPKHQQTDDLELDFNPMTTDAITVAFKKASPAEAPRTAAAAPARNWLAVALLVLVACGLIVLVV